MSSAPRPRKRALFVINSLVSGGAERVMCTLLAASEAERAEYEIELVLLDDEPPVYSPPPWVRVHQLDCRSSLPRSIFALREVFARTRPDVILSFLTRANIAAVAGAKSLGIPCVISERIQNSAHLGAGLSAQIAKQIIRLAYPRADHIIAVSSGVSKDLETAFGVAKRQITVIDNPVDAEAIENAGRAPSSLAIAGPYIVGVGRLTSVKNFALLIRAFHDSAYRGRLVIIGEGPERPQLEHLIRELGLAERVFLPGHVDNPFPLVRGADIFVSSSNAEGFPNALVEAMALRVPVIATNCPAGPAEILAETEREAVHGLTEGRSGILTPLNDADALTRAIDMLHSTEVRASWAEKAQQRVRDFSVRRAKDRYWAVLKGAAARR